MVFVDNLYAYGAVNYETKMIYAIETGMPGVFIREVEEHSNTLVTCPNKARTGKIIFRYTNICLN